MSAYSGKVDSDERTYVGVLKICHLNTDARDDQSSYSWWLWEFW